MRCACLGKLDMDANAMLLESIFLGLAPKGHVPCAGGTYSVQLESLAVVLLCGTVPIGWGTSLQATLWRQAWAHELALLLSRCCCKSEKVERFCANGGVRLHSSDQAHANTLAAHLQTKAIANNPHRHSFDLQVARRLLHSR